MRSCLTASKPVKRDDGSENASKKPKDKNRGFRTAEDGRLIIEEPRRGAKSADSESSDDDDDGGEADAAAGLGEKPRRTIDDSDSDDDDMPKLAATARKRKAADSSSMASGKTGASSYVAGGRGIHRPLAAASVRSGMSSASTHAASTAHGSEYRAKKAKGDLKKKGQKMDPYAYIPLNRTSLNKRYSIVAPAVVLNLFPNQRLREFFSSVGNKRKTPANSRASWLAPGRGQRPARATTRSASCEAPDLQPHCGGAYESSYCIYKHTHLFEYFINIGYYYCFYHIRIYQ